MRALIGRLLLWLIEGGQTRRRDALKLHLTAAGAALAEAPQEQAGRGVMGSPWPRPAAEVR